ncbi:Uncharacterised protein [Mycobacterium tuberculosis]|nr:Uncharacterised protein [Mycobacterium tuberculosis]
MGRSGPRTRLARTIRRRRQQQLHHDEWRHQSHAAVDAFGQRKLGCRTSPERTRVPRVKRADPGRVFADGVAERQQRPAALVCAAGPGRRLRRPVVRRLRQPLRRPAGSDNLLSADPVDALAPARDRDAVHPAVSGAWPPAREYTPGAAAGIRYPPRHGGRQSGGPGGRHRSHRCDTRTGRLRASPAGLPGRGRPCVLVGQRHGGGQRLAAGRTGREAGRAEIPR